MSEPIRNKKVEFPTAPTPQNTPANNAPISSHAQQPGVASIKEEDLDRAAAASLFAQNPALVSMIQGKLGSLIGKSSGYIESLPAPVRRRVAGLKGIQKQHAALEAELQEKILQLEKEYLAKYAPIYAKRAEIVSGKSEPTEDEVTAGKQDEDEDEEETKAEGEAKTEETEKSPAAGIPEFWLSAMKNHISLSDMITERDEEALKSLTDIRMEYTDRPGYRLIFEFAENEFFSNKTISKSYFYQEENGYAGDFLYDHAEGEEIKWKEGKDLTIRYESKKQRNRSTKQTRVVKVKVPTDSFFNFFSPPKPPAEDDDDDDVASDIEERLELDYQLGEEVKEKLIPRAVDWFTGEALQFEEFDGDMDEDEFDDDDDEDDDDEDDRSDGDLDDESDEEDDGSKPKKEAAECKQS